MGAAELAAALRAEAEKEERAVVAAAEARAAALWDEAGKRCAALDAGMRKMEERCRAGEQALAEGRGAIRDRKRRAAMEEGYVTAVHAECRRRFAAFMRSPGYAPYITQLFRRASEELGGAVEAVADPHTAAVLGGAFQNLTITQSTADDPGFIALGPGGNVRIIATFETLFGKAWREAAPRLMPDVAKAVADGL